MQAGAKSQTLASRPKETLFEVLDEFTFASLDGEIHYTVCIRYVAR